MFFRPARRALLCCAALVLVALPAAAPSGAATSAATLTLSRHVGPPTTILDVSGSGFGASESVDVFFDTTDLAVVTTDPGGSFGPTSIQVPADAVPGLHTISAVGRTSGLSAQAGFRVRTNWAAFHRGPWHQGFNRFENVLDAGNVSGLAPAWTASTGGGISSSPAVKDGVVYV